MRQPDDAPVTPSALIAESLRAVLDAHGFVICRHSDTTYPLDDARLSALLREAGNNAAQVVLLHQELSK